MFVFIDFAIHRKQTQSRYHIHSYTIQYNVRNITTNYAHSASSCIVLYLCFHHQTVLVFMFNCGIQDEINKECRCCQWIGGALEVCFSNWGWFTKCNKLCEVVKRDGKWSLVSQREVVCGVYPARCMFKYLILKWVGNA